MTVYGIPTLYNGAQFRSRLEARWAAFFDLCGWRWDYEPFDLQGWIPDFALHGPDGKFTLVEVKPVTRFEDHDGQRELRKCDQDLLLLGLGPFPSSEYSDHSAALGWVSQVWGGNGSREYEVWAEAIFGVSKGGGYAPWFSFVHALGGWNCYITGRYDGDGYFPQMSPADAIRMWQQAGSKVQWRGVRTVKT